MISHVGPPKIIFISNHTVSTEGNKVILICIAISDVDTNHSLQINWYKGNKLVIPNGKSIILHQEPDSVSRQLKSIILFDPVNCTDDGEYTCRAFNHNDSFSELNTTLTIQCMA